MFALGLYTILSLPILYGAGHTKGRSRGGRILSNSRAIVWLQSGRYRRTGGIKGRLIRAQTTLSKENLVKAKFALVTGEIALEPGVWV